MEPKPFRVFMHNLGEAINHENAQKIANVAEISAAKKGRIREDISHGHCLLKILEEEGKVTNKEGGLCYLHSLCVALKLVTIADFIEKKAPGNAIKMGRDSSPHQEESRKSSSKPEAIDVFISYKLGVHGKEMLKLISDLEEKGVKSWFCQNNLKIGDPMWKDIERSQSVALITLCIISEDYLKSESCEREVLFAEQQGKKIIPVFLEGARRDNIPYGIKKPLSTPLSEKLPFKDWHRSSIYKGIINGIRASVESERARFGAKTCSDITALGTIPGSQEQGSPLPGSIPGLAPTKPGDKVVPKLPTAKVTPPSQELLLNNPTEETLMTEGDMGDPKDEFDSKGFQSLKSIESNEYGRAENIDHQHWYERKKQIGRGSTKDVYEAFNKKTQQYVAWSEILLPHMKNEEKRDLEDKAREIKILKTLEHDKIVRFIDYFVIKNDNSEIYVMITELMKEDMNAYLVRLHDEGKLLPKERIISWGRQILEGLKYLHVDMKASCNGKSICHLDLNCRNIFLSSDTNSIKIADFGISKVKRGIKNSTTASKVAGGGTRGFASLEILYENGDKQSDVYSFGMCLVQMSTLEIPYKDKSEIIFTDCLKEGTPPTCLSKVTDPDLKKVIEKCIQKEIHDRPTVEELLNEPYFATDDSN